MCSSLRGLIFLLLLCSGPGTAHAQSISGRVESNLGEPLPGVNVFIATLEKGAVTDFRGNYVIDELVAGTYTLSFSFIGFKSVSEVVEVSEADVVLNVTLQQEVLESEEVVIATAREDALTVDARSVSIIEPEELEDVRGQTLGETLEHLPGVTTLNTGPSIAKPVVRGLHSQRVLVLNAGISLEGQQWGGEHAPEIDPFAPVRIEVVKGVAGVEYGMGAIGGVIRLDPVDLPYLPEDGLRGRFSANGFSNNLQAAGALYLEGGAGFLPGLGWRMQGSFRKAGDTHAPNYIIGNSAFAELNGSASVGLRREGMNIVALYSRFSTELGIFSGAHIGNVNDLLRAIERGEPSFQSDFGYEIGVPKQKIAHDLATVHGDFRLKSGHLLEGHYGLQVNHRQEFDAHGRGDDVGTSPAFDLSLISHSLEFKFQHRPFRNSVGVIGVNGLNQLNKNDATGFLIPNFRALSGGVFGRQTWVFDALTLESGLRFDYRWVRAWPRENGSRGPFVKRITDYASVSGVVGGIWQFAPDWSIGANLGSGWRPPSVNELYNFGVHHGTAQFEIGDPNLESERSVGIDVTIRHESKASRLEFSLYNTFFEKFIYRSPTNEPRVTIRGTFPTFVYTQSDAVLKGFDMAFEHDPVDYLTLSMQTSLVRGDNPEADEPLINMPSDRLIPGITFHLPAAKALEHTDISLEAIMVRKQTRVPPNVDYAEPPDGYILLNAGISTTLAFENTALSMHFEIENLFNTAYRDYLSRFRYFTDDPGRSVILRLHIPIGSTHTN